MISIRACGSGLEAGIGKGLDGVDVVAFPLEEDKETSGWVDVLPKFSACSVDLVVLEGVGTGDFFAARSIPEETLLFRSNDAGFFGNSGDGDFSSFLGRFGDFPGVIGFSFSEALTGVLVTEGSSLVLDGTELGRICSALTSGTLAIGFTFSPVSSRGASANCGSALLAVGFRRLGPRARPLVMCVNSGTGPVFSTSVGLVLSKSLSLLE